MLPTLSIIIRAITKYARLGPVGPDDYTIVAAYVILVGYTSSHAYLEHHGAGKDLWTLTHGEIFVFFKIFYALQVLYHLCIDLIKASILFSYLRIFHLPDEKIRIVLWSTMVVNLLSGLSFLFVSLFRCQPVSLAWTFWTGDAAGKCINLVNISISHASINIALDLWMLTLPVTQIWSMNLARRKKFTVIAMFSLGLFLTVVSAVRISAILDFRKDPLNPTVAMLPIVVWSAIELNVGIFTACIPNIRQFFVRFILGHSEKKKRLESVMSGYARGSTSAPKPQGLTHQFDNINELEPVNESNLSSPSCKKSMVNV
ncbi:CFEM domain-containing protein [Colletotrichum caudatum]|nr:CFEM domain-containing protein [Colletotrichum caudatum]